jgi:hypothetical protein
MKNRKSTTERIIPDREPPPNAPGSIEQQLDMCEAGPLKGDEISHERSRARGLADGAILDTDRETVEMTGDDHSLGLQGGEEELKHQPHIHSGVPGTEEEEHDQETDDIERHRAS